MLFQYREENKSFYYDNNYYHNNYICFQKKNSRKSHEVFYITIVLSEKWIYIFLNCYEFEHQQEKVME